MTGWLRVLFSRARRERELAEELESNLALHIEDNLRSGMTREEATRQARLKFGGMQVAKEEYRETAGWAFLEAIFQDARFGMRMLRKSPVWSLVVGATLALGIGLTTAIFSIVYSVLLQPLPYKDPGQLVALWSTSTRQGSLSRFNVIAANWKDWRQQSRLLEDVALVRYVANFNLTGEGAPERIQGARTSANLATVLGVPPLLGRTFTEEEAMRDAPVAVLSYAFWQRRFAGNPAIVGRKIQLNGTPFEVVGVMPREYRYPTRDFELWTPLFHPADELRDRGIGNYSAVGRMRPGVTREQAQQEISAIMRRLEEQYPVSNKNLGAVVEPLLDDNVRDVKTALYVLMGAAACLLLIGCMNLSILLIGRATARAKEMSLRAALGAGAPRIRRQMLMELMPLGLLGTVGGLAAASLLLRASQAWLPTNLPRAESIGLHGPVLVFSILASLGTVLAAALLPSRIASRIALAQALQQESRGSSSRGGVRNALVIAQVAGAMVLVLAGGLFVRSLTEVLRVNPGFDSEGVLTLHLAVTRARYPKDPQVAEYYRRIIQRIQPLPGVQAVGYVNRLPLSGLNQTNSVEAEGKQDSLQSTDSRTITPQYFDVMKIPLLAGRTFSLADREDKPAVVIVDEALARNVFGGLDAVGKRIRFGYAAQPWMEIIGVAGHVRNDSLEADSRPQIYQPTTQRTQDRGALVIRTAGDPASLSSAVIDQIRAEDPDQPVYDVRTMREWMDRTLASRNLLTTVVAAFSAAALLLACLGLYGVMAYTASLRSREFGIRLALGAQPSQVRGDVLRQAGKLVLFGLAAGLALAWPAMSLIRSLLFGVAAADPLTLFVAPCVLLAVALLATLAPAQRAAKTDPALALRQE